MFGKDNEIHELKKRVEKLERQMASLLQHQDFDYREKPTQIASLEIMNLMREGKKIQAIKLYRQETGVGLKQAKEFVESLNV